MPNSDIEIGKTYEAVFPFVRVTSLLYPDTQRWKPGFQRELEAPDGGSTTTMATGMGKVLLTVIAVCELPGRYQDRVFFKRKWVAPDNTELGGKSIDVCTLGAFQRKLEGLVPDDWDENYSVEERGDIF